MNVWAIGDLHLSYDENGDLIKPMAIFGRNWENHDSKIKENWEKTVEANDLVLIPGDFSWAMSLESMQYDLTYLSSLPGRKILLRGNHDYWWTSSKKMKAFLPENVDFIQNNAIQIAECLYVCGTRGWTVPGENTFTPEDEKIYRREVQRLRLSLESLPDPEADVIVMFHYPPTNMKYEKSAFIDLLEEYGVKTCIYAHLHDASIGNRLPLEKWGISFNLVSADAVNFTPYKVKLNSVGV